MSESDFLAHTREVVFGEVIDRHQSFGQLAQMNDEELARAVRLKDGMPVAVAKITDR